MTELTQIKGGAVETSQPEIDQLVRNLVALHSRGKLKGIALVVLDDDNENSFYRWVGRDDDSIGSCEQLLIIGERLKHSILRWLQDNTEAWP